MTIESVPLEQQVRFSKSLLWQYQRNYFDKKGINAWARGEVPYYITSNTLIAKSYAEITLRYLQDSLENDVINIKEPIYMFELGTGSGKFSYLFISQLTKLLQEFKLDHLKFCYVLTDFTENNIDYWQQHPQFQPFLQQGILDFALFKIGETESIHLIKRNITLDPNSCKNPILAIGNYIFDTVPHDAFRIKNKQLEESLISINTPQDNLADNEPVSLDKLETAFTYREINLPYYDNNLLDNILLYYQEHFSGGNFLIPIGAISAIDALRALSKNRLFFITGDKGYTSLESMEDLDAPHIAFHGSFSMMVNFDFLGRYIKNLRGDTLLADDYAGMKISLLSLGQIFADLPETSWANEQFNRHFSTKEFLILKNKIIDDASNLDLEQIIALLKLSYWDADIFMSLSTRLSDIVNQAGRSHLRALRAGLKEIANHYYFIKNNKNVYFELARVFHLIGDLNDAINYYQKSLEFFGDDTGTYFNLGLCYYYKQDLPTSTTHFRRALELDPNNKPAKDWLTYIEEQEQKK
jgi:tetratricopeptide (TPR) repeat protein